MPRHEVSDRLIERSVGAFERQTTGVSPSRVPHAAEELGATLLPQLRLVLSAAERADLERLAQHRPTGSARRAGLILARADGETLNVIALRFDVHPDTVRRWLARFDQHGLAGLRHRGSGKSRNLVFGAQTRAEIRHRANIDPTQLGEAFPVWSLFKLRDHLIRHGVVRTISHETLRRVLLTEPLSRRYWRFRRSRDGRA